MLIKLYEENPSERHLKRIVECLQDGGIVIYPTDTVYSFGCGIAKPKALDQIAQIKGFNAAKHNFTLIFNDLSQISNYTKPIDNSTFRLLKRALPGPFTFILEANKQIPKVFQNKKKQVGIRVPDNIIPCTIVEMLQTPILSSSVYHDDEMLEYRIDPELIHDQYGDRVDIVIDGGFGDLEPSTIVDCTGGNYDIIRQGKGNLNQFL